MRNPKKAGLKRDQIEKETKAQREDKREDHQSGSHRDREFWEPEGAMGVHLRE